MKLIYKILCVFVLLFILNNEIVQSDVLDASAATKKPVPFAAKQKVFIVHGRNTVTRTAVFNKLVNMGFEPIILYERANNGDTIIEKLEREVDSCQFGVVIMSPDNVIQQKGENGTVITSEQVYPRLNVIFEFGLLIGRYGRQNVIYLNVPYTGTGYYDLPSDLLGYVWVNYTDDLKELENEIKIGNYTKSKKLVCK